MPSEGAAIGEQSGTPAARYIQRADRAPTRSNEEPTMTAASTAAERPTRRGHRVRRESAAVAQLVRAAAGGDHHAWEALVEEFGGLVWAVARAHRLSDADAADVAGATWLRLVEHLGSLREADRVGAWLATTARRECLHVLRSAQRQTPTGDDLDSQPSEPTDIAGELMIAERDVALWRAFGRLPERDRALLRLLVADPGPSYEEISAALEMPVGSIGPTRARSLERLRRELAREGVVAADAV
jgi:RNA polymerase sigma factor (sigma-70 family)